jgi:DNA-binding MarR family transcriptional regulator
MDARSQNGHAHEASLIYVVGRVHQGLRREMRTRLGEFHLSVQEYTALSVLKARPALSNAQLARRALVTPQSMIEILAKLEARGLVKRRVDRNHQRILRAELTPEGENLLAAADPAIRAIHEKVLAGVPARQREIANTALLTVMKNLSSGQR